MPGDVVRNRCFECLASKCVLAIQAMGGEFGSGLAIECENSDAVGITHREVSRLFFLIPEPFADHREITDDRVCDRAHEFQATDSVGEVNDTDLVF